MLLANYFFFFFCFFVIFDTPFEEEERYKNLISSMSSQNPPILKSLLPSLPHLLPFPPPLPSHSSRLKLESEFASGAANAPGFFAHRAHHHHHHPKRALDHPLMNTLTVIIASSGQHDVGNTRPQRVSS